MCGDRRPCVVRVDRFLEAGGLVTPCAVKSLSDVTGYAIVVNCTGLGARKLTGDHRLVPIRGQIFQVRTGSAGGT